MDWRATRNLGLTETIPNTPKTPDTKGVSALFGVIGDTSGKASGRVLPPTGVKPTPETTVSATAITWPQRSSRPFLVAIDGSTCCPACGQAGRIPHHLSLIFWKFWTREQLAALVEAMRPDERLAWLAKGLVKVESADGQTRALREVGGRWDAVPK
jgi:hypothetical protein